jgi:hypothetical protein
MRLRAKVTAGMVIVLLAVGYQAGHQATKPPAKSVALSAPGMPANERLANEMAAAKGWGATQQACLDHLWSEESAGTWDPTVANPSSQAFGIAQALGHGSPATRGSLSDMYGGFGLTSAQARQANSGSARWQIAWGLKYIAITYVTPCAAWQHETSTNPNWY